jgi:hypothetical protein
MTARRGDQMEREYFGKGILATLWLALRIGAGMYVGGMAMRAAEHMGASPLEAGFATIVGALVWVAIMILEIVKASEIKVDGLVQEWRDSREQL